MEESFTNKNVILASQSPRRHSLIKKIISNFDVVAPEFDEKLDSLNYTDDAIQSLSLQKALSVLNTHKKTGLRNLRQSENQESGMHGFNLLHAASFLSSYKPI